MTTSETPTRTIRFVNKEILEYLNDEALRLKRNRALNREFVASLPSDVNFPITFSLLHNDYEVRVVIVFNEHGHTGWLDIPLAVFNKLPTAEVSA